MNSRLHSPVAPALMLLAVVSSATAVGLEAQDWAPRGITEPYRDATLSTTVTGIVSAVVKKEGQSVRQGEVLVELEREEEALEVERRRLIAESTVEVTAIRYRLETQSLDLEATRKLFESTGSVSREELLQKELEYKLLQAELERLLIAERREEIEYRIAQAHLQKYLITAPFDGVVVKTYIEAGENCSPQQDLIRIADTSRCRLIVLMDTGVSAGLELDQDVRLRIEGIRSPTVYTGTVEYLSPVVDPSSGLREVKVLFDNPNGHVYPGLTGTLLLK